MQTCKGRQIRLPALRLPPDVPGNKNGKRFALHKDMSTQILNEGRRKKWILIANRSEAKLLETDGKVDQLNLLKDIPFPDGRKQNHEINTDGHGSRFSSVAQQKHGLNRHEEATEHKANVFAKELCELLHDGRTRQEYDELILVAEPNFLGRLRGFLDKETASRVLASINHNWVPFRNDELHKKIKEVVREAV